MSKRLAFGIMLAVSAVALLYYNFRSWQEYHASYADRFRSALELSPRETESANPGELSNAHSSMVDTTSIGTSGVEAKIENLRKELSELERKNGKDSLTLVPVLVQLAVLSSDVSSPAILDRSLTISEAATKGKPPAKEALSAAWSLETVLFSSRGARGTRPNSSFLRPALLLKLKAEGLNFDSRSTVMSLCSHLISEREGDEASQLLKIVMDYEKKSGESTPAGEAQWKALYTGALRVSGRDKEAGEAEADSLATQRRQQAKLAGPADEALEKARKKAEVDPHGLVQAAMHSASVHLRAGDKPKARERFDEAMKVYENVPASSSVDELDRSTTNFVQAWLQTAETKEDEEIAVTFLDAAEKRAAQGHQQGLFAVEEICRYYTGMHRQNDLCSVLQHVISRRRQLRPDDIEAIQLLTLRQAALYDDCGKPDLALKVNEAALQEAESRYGKQDPRLVGPLVGAAGDYQLLKKQDRAIALADRASALVQDAEPVKNTFKNIQLIVDCYLSNKQLKNADKVLRIGYQLLRSADESVASSNYVLMERSLRKLVDKLSLASQFESAESLIALDRSVRIKLNRGDHTWARDLSDLYLQHAGWLKQKGQLAESKRMLALSKAEFNRLMNEMDLRHIDPESRKKYLDEYNRQRQTLMENLKLVDEGKAAKELK